MKYLLVIIDPQNDFTHEDGHYVTRHGICQIAAAKSRINLLTDSKQYDKIIVRADYQPGQFIPGVSLALPGTFGYEIDAGIVVPVNMAIFNKCAHSCFSSGDFQNLLAKSACDTLLLCGFLAEYCIRQTGLDATTAGYHVILVKDAIGTGDDVQYRREAVLEELAQKGCTLLDAADCLKL